MKNKLAAITGFLSFLLVPFVSAAQSTMAVSIEWFLDKVVVIFITLNEKTVVLFIFGKEASYLALIATWIMLYSLIWVGSGNIPPFKNDTSSSHSGARKMFAISVSLLVAFGSPMAAYITSFLRTGFNYALSYGFILLTILIFWAFTKWFGWGTSSLTGLGADNAKRRSEAGKDREIARKQRYDNKATEKMAKKEKNLAHSLNRDIRRASGAFPYNMPWFNKTAAFFGIKGKRNLMEHLEELRKKLISAQDVKSVPLRQYIDKSIHMLNSFIEGEGKELQLETQIDHLTHVLSEENMKEKELLIKEHLDQEKDMRMTKKEYQEALTNPNMSKKIEYKKWKEETHMFNSINQVRADCNEVQRLISEMKINEGKWRSFIGQADRSTRELINYLKRDPPYLRGAIDIIPPLINELEAEGKLEDQLNNEIELITRFLNHDLTKLKFTGKEAKEEELLEFAEEKTEEVNEEKSKKMPTKEEIKKHLKTL